MPNIRKIGKRSFEQLLDQKVQSERRVEEWPWTAFVTLEGLTLLASAASIVCNRQSHLSTIAKDSFITFIVGTGISISVGMYTNMLLHNKDKSLGYKILDAKAAMCPNKMEPLSPPMRYGRTRPQSMFTTFDYHDDGIMPSFN